MIEFGSVAELPFHQLANRSGHEDEHQEKTKHRRARAAEQRVLVGVVPTAQKPVNQVIKHVSSFPVSITMLFQHPRRLTTDTPILCATASRAVPDFDESTE